LKGHGSLVAEKLIDKGKKCQGTASEPAEKLIGSGKKCQGTASAVPPVAHSKSRGFSP
jgi:hypothetical protein